MLWREKPYTASTDMGNVSQIVPSFHGAFGVPTAPGIAIHNPRFAAAAGTDEAHEVCLKCAKGMAMLAIQVLLDDELASSAVRDFEHDKDW